MIPSLFGPVCCGLGDKRESDVVQSFLCLVRCERRNRNLQQSAAAIAPTQLCSLSLYLYLRFALFLLSLASSLALACSSICIAIAAALISLICMAADGADEWPLSLLIVVDWPPNVLMRRSFAAQANYCYCWPFVSCANEHKATCYHLFYAKFWSPRFVLRSPVHYLDP